MNFDDNFYSLMMKNECFIDKKEAEQFIQNLYDLLFGTREQKNTTKEYIDSELSILRNRLKIVLLGIVENKEVDDFLDFFFNKIPFVYKQLLKDAEFIKESDPASVSIEEVKVAYPGFFAIVVYRFSNVFYLKNIPLLPRILSEYAHGKTGIDIHPGATIGCPFMIDHGTGIVIGETTEIGNNVKVFQGVTLGALSVSRDKKNKKRHPTIKNNVIIYAGATILGGDSVVGENTIIGGNVWLTESVEANSKIFNKRK
ncbi:MAG: serine acetyltransferase [Tenacibaculum sp.]|nr:serine acetyltransferase [Tenacibaculum sp.]